MWWDNVEIFQSAGQVDACLIVANGGMCLYDWFEHQMWISSSIDHALTLSPITNQRTPSPTCNDHGSEKKNAISTPSNTTDVSVSMTEDFLKIGVAHYDWPQKDVRNMFGILKVI